MGPPGLALLARRRPGYSRTCRAGASLRPIISTPAGASTNHECSRPRICQHYSRPARTPTRPLEVGSRCFPSRSLLLRQNMVIRRFNVTFWTLILPHFILFSLPSCGLKLKAHPTNAPYLAAECGAQVLSSQSIGRTCLYRSECMPTHFLLRIEAIRQMNNNYDYPPQNRLQCGGGCPDLSPHAI